MKLDLGSGPKPAAGYVTVDLRGKCDIRANLEHAEDLRFAVRQWQAQRDREPITAIRAYHVLEHIHNLLELMDACWELLAPGGTMEIVVPHRESETAWADPTHVRYFTPGTFHYFVTFKHFHYTRHYWEYATEPRGVDAYNNPITEGPWAGIHVTLRKPEQEQCDGRQEIQDYA